MLRKLNRAAGFTLAETLVAVLILLMFTAVVAEGLPAAVSAYRKAVDASNAQILLSTTVDALRGELSTAWDVETDGTTISYKSSHTGAESKIYLDDKKQIILEEYAGDDGNSPDWLEGDKIKPPKISVLPSKALTKSLAGEMKVTYSGVARVPETGKVEYVKITGLEVKSAADKVAAKMPDSEDGADKEVLLIRVLSGGDGA